MDSTIRKQSNIRNIAIIAHIDHGKTTLIDSILKQTGAMGSKEEGKERVLDFNDLEKERGITIFAKNAAINYKGVKINIIDTPGHSDFSGEVERVLKMAEGVLLLVDAAEGPLSQTRFVLQKSLELKLKPIVVINKIDRKDARPSEVLDEIYELFIDLGASSEQLEFPVVYAVGREGVAKLNLKDESKNLDPLFDTIINKIQAPTGDREKPFQFLVTTLDYNDFLGRIAIGKVENGRASVGQTIALIDEKNQINNFKITKIFTFNNLGRVEMQEVSAGDLAAIAGVFDVNIGDTIASAENPVALPRISIDEPTISVNFLVNDSPFSGREGKLVTIKKIEERLLKEAETNVSLKVEKVESVNAFNVSGRGVLHLAILVERMRREGFELALSQPKVITKKVNGETLEPIEELMITVLSEFSGKVIENLGRRGAELVNMKNLKNNDVQLIFKIPSRGLIGFRSEFITMTRGLGVLAHRLLGYEKLKGNVSSRTFGVLVSIANGKALSYALNNIEKRGKLFVGPGEDIYEGRIIGVRPESGDLTVNPCKGKHMTNVRMSTALDEKILLSPKEEITLERAIEFIADDELVEVTPKSFRLRKIDLKDVERKKRKKAASS